MYKKSALVGMIACGLLLNRMYPPSPLDVRAEQLSSANVSVRSSSSSRPNSGEKGGREERKLPYDLEYFRG